MDKGNVVYVYNGICTTQTKKKEILLFATTWMDLEGVMLHETDRKYCMNSLTCGILTKIERNHRLVVVRVGGQRVGEMGEDSQKV